MTKMILVRLYKTPDMRKILANPRTKNPPTGKCPFMYGRTYDVNTHEFAEVKAGRGAVIDNIERDLRAEGYKGRVDVLERVNPRVGSSTPKFFRVGRGPRLLHTWEIV